MDKLLVIPHVSTFDVRVRSHEIAKRLADHYDVHYLYWADVSPRNGSVVSRRARQFWRELTQSFGRCSSVRVPSDRLTYVSAPMRFRPLLGRLEYNRRGVAKLCRRLGISRILNASGASHITGGLDGVVSVYDLVDDHVSLASERSKPVTETVIEHEMATSDQIVTISHALIDLIREQYDREAHYVPNGVDFDQMAAVSGADVAALRQQLGLEGKYVIGCIGNHGPWSGLGLLIDAFKAIQPKMPDAVLLIVGPGPEVATYGDQASEHIRFTGPVSPQVVSTYFHAIDLGTLSFDLLPFTENALPIKVLEYGAARKLTLATPLKELKTLALPGVMFAPPTVEAWAEALCEARERPWQDTWREAYDQFDWARVAQKVCDAFDLAGEPSAR